jgi:hypothetical protein
MKSPITHVSIGYRGVDGADHEAHMWGSPVSRFRDEKRPLHTRTFRQIRFNPIKMAEGRYETYRSFFSLKERYIKEDQNLANFKTLYGENWENEVSCRYEEITKQFFGNEANFKTLKNPKARRFWTAVGFRFSIREKPWQEKVRITRVGSVVCSEFAVKTSLQCLDLLNKKIEAEWKQSGHEGKAPELYPPIRANRRLNRVLPHEILKRGLNTKTIVVEEVPKVMTEAVEFSPFAI